MAKIAFSRLNFIIMPVTELIILALTANWQGTIFSLSLGIMNLLLLTKSSINLKKLSIFTLGLVPALGATYLTGHLFINASPMTSNSIAFNLCLRLYAIAMISFMYVIHMPKEETMLELMQRKLLPVTIGFGLLATFNAFNYFGLEFKRIQLAYQMRFHKRLYSPRIILPLLVAGARYAHHTSISMFSRGLSSQRTYNKEKTRINFADLILWISNLIIIIIYHYQ